MRTFMRAEIWESINIGLFVFRIHYDQIQRYYSIDFKLEPQK